MRKPWAVFMGGAFIGYVYAETSTQAMKAAAKQYGGAVENKLFLVKSIE